ncbi:ShlB/FhaC/HecB family hemolysin secretion/activation protein [Nitrincola schmidtii]|uniref:ShlB/FhaC/HecB family hemolysin secretion/activation protein n=1 Tax=Nitrincola schmidtii TaxID=1730894 RepID=UPI00124F02B8|nr:ShlB/FhaC/HecB family hemolysin secretion/activation protein [Nitrincola schmidtii]
MTVQPFFKPSILALAVAFSLPVAAQTPPDAGRILQDSLPQTLQPLAPSVDFTVEGQPLTDAEPGGATVNLTGIRFTGNSIYSAEALMAVLGDVIGNDYDLAGLRQLANQISIHYRNNGYPFARAVIPAQNMSEGVLVIQLIEGRYGQVITSGDASVAADALPFLHQLKPGNVIESTQLERSTLLLGDLPGVRVVPVMRPSAEVGAGDLDVQVFEEPQFSGSVGLDNHGNRFSGEYRGQTDLRYNRLLMLGDELSVRALYTSEDTWLGQVGYSLPLGYSGLRGNVSYAHTDYQLGKDFSALGATGLAKVTSVGLSYPILRSQRSNLVLAGSYDYKELKDNRTQDDFSSKKTVNSIPVSLQFDHRDGLGGGGITFGNLQITSGRLKQSDNNDQSEKYSFTKTNLQLARLQRVNDQITLFGNVSTQYADKRDLDGSESFSLGGPNGVRAFPVGEGSDSRGWLAQIEMRYAIDAHFSPYAFYDAGSTPRGGVDSDRRNLAGAGIGLRYNRDAFSMDLSSAWKIEGGEADSDDKQRDPRIWFTMNYRF